MIEGKLFDISAEPDFLDDYPCSLSIKTYYEPYTDPKFTDIYLTEEQAVKLCEEITDSIRKFNEVKS